MQIKAFASTAATALASALLVFAANPATAQKVYRIVGPDGRVTFSDRAPSSDTPSQASAGTTSSESGGSSLAGLPLEVKQASSKYPLTLYTAKDCSSCDAARSYLQGRGVPYTEKTITSNDEIAALKKLSGADSVPFATLGGQHLKGFNSNDWSAYLDAAGYPAKSQLPASYRQAAAVPLIPKAVKPAAASTGAAAPEGAAPAGSNSIEPKRVTPDNPSGIVF